MTVLDHDGGSEAQTEFVANNLMSQSDIGRVIIPSRTVNMASIGIGDRAEVTQSLAIGGLEFPLL